VHKELQPLLGLAHGLTCMQVHRRWQAQHSQITGNHYAQLYSAVMKCIHCSPAPSRPAHACIPDTAQLHATEPTVRPCTCRPYSAAHHCHQPDPHLIRPAPTPAPHQVAAAWPHTPGAQSARPWRMPAAAPPVYAADMQVHAPFTPYCNPTSAGRGGRRHLTEGGGPEARPRAAAALALGTRLSAAGRLRGGGRGRERSNRRCHPSSRL